MNKLNKKSKYYTRTYFKPTINCEALYIKVPDGCGYGGKDSYSQIVFSNGKMYFVGRKDGKVDFSESTSNTLLSYKVEVLDIMIINTKRRNIYIPNWLYDLRLLMLLKQ